MIKWIYKPAGNCPVESEGYFLNQYFYFRARYDYITIDFAPSYTDWWADKNIIQYTLRYKKDANYGQYSKWRCIPLIYWGCWLYVWNKKILKK